MTLEWVVSVQQHIERAEHKMRALADGYKPLGDEREPEVIARILDLLNKLSRWAQIFPHDEMFWLMVNPARVLEASELRTILSFLEVLLAFRENNLLTKPDPLEPAIQAIKDEISAAREIKTDKTVLDAPTQCSPRMIIQEIYVKLYPWRISQPPNNSLLFDEPPVLYGPIIHNLIMNLAVRTFILHASESAKLAAQQTPRFFEIVLTSTALHLTPGFWDALVMAVPNQLEYLREIGGHIEPLTWTEGQGEGVIVRLPWVEEA